MNRLEAIGRLLTLRCEEATLLASRERDEPIGAADRLAMWGHLLACRSCRRFRGQLRLLGESYRRRESDPAGSGGSGLAPESRLRIAEALRRASEGAPSEDDRRCGS